MSIETAFLILLIVILIGWFIAIFWELNEIRKNLK